LRNTEPDRLMAASAVSAYRIQKPARGARLQPRWTGPRCSARTWVGSARLTNDHGIFMRTIRVKRGALFRIWSPSQRRCSLQLRIW
jgi:hypothetical protein